MANEKQFGILPLAPCPLPAATGSKFLARVGPGAGTFPALAWPVAGAPPSSKCPARVGPSHWATRVGAGALISEGERFAVFLSKKKLLLGQL